MILPLFDLKCVVMREKSKKLIVFFMVLGLIGLWSLAGFLFFFIPFPKHPFFHLISVIIYDFIIILFFIWLAILINRYSEK